MATIASGTKSATNLERGFFFRMAVAMALVIVAGFSFNLAVGRSTFAAPLLIHVHAFVFFGWVTLFVTQAFLVAGGSVQLHRQLGVLALILLPVMVALGFAVTINSLRTIGGPPFIDMNEFLFGNTSGIVVFAGLVVAALLRRERMDWHRRLMCCSLAVLTGPAFGRLLPMPYLIPWAWWAAAVAGPLLFMVIGMVRDYRRRGSVHPAWLFGVAALVGVQLLADLVAYSPSGMEITRNLVAGTPGAERDMQAFVP